MQRFWDWLGPVGLGAIAIGVLGGGALAGWSSLWAAIPTSLGALALLGWVLTHLPQIQAFFGLRSTQSNVNIAISVAAVVAILAMLNVLGVRYSTQFDLSEGALYSLYSQTETVVRQLQSPVKVTMVSTNPNPSIRTQLERYRDLNPAQLQLEIVNPQRDPARARQLEVSTDDTIVVAANSGQDTSGEKRQQFPQPMPLNLESELTPAILQVTDRQQQTVYFAQGHGERPLKSDGDNPGLTQAVAALKREGFATQPLNLVQTETVPADAAAVVVAAPQQPWLPAEVKRLQTYLDAGGKVMLLLDPLTDPGFDPLLKDWGITFDNDLVVETSQVSQVLGTGPSVALVSEYGDHPITTPLIQKGVMTFFPLARSVETSSPTGTVLLQSSPQSWGESDPSAEQLQFDPATDRKGPLPLGVALQRPAETDATDSAQLNDASGREDPTEAAEANSPAANPLPETVPAESRLVAIGNAGFAADGNFPQLGNGDLFLNAVNWLAERSNAIAIRPKSPTNRRFALTGQNLLGLGVLSTIVLPLLALGTGGTIWWQRR